MVAEWEAIATKFTELTAHLQYSTSSWRMESHLATLHWKPCGIVVMLSTETFHQQLNQEEADSSKLLGTGIFLWVILSEAHQLRTCETPICEFRKANGTLVNMDSCHYNVHMASCILSQELQFNKMLMATPLVNGINDYCWILRFLDSSWQLSRQLLHDSFHHTFNMNDNWVTDASNVSDSKYGAGFTPDADPYMNGPDFKILVHHLTMAWDDYMFPPIIEGGK